MNLINIEVSDEFVKAANNNADYYGISVEDYLKYIIGFPDWYIDRCCSIDSSCNVFDIYITEMEINKRLSDTDI